MTKLKDKTIRRRADGSIDAAYYMQKGREERSSMLRSLIEFPVHRMILQMPVSRRAEPDSRSLLKEAGVS